MVTKSNFIMSASYSQNLDSQIIQRFRREVSNGEVPIDDIALWALQKGLWAAPMQTQLSLLKKDLSKALRSKTFTDEQGRKVRINHCVRQEQERSDGTKFVQSVWSSIDVASPTFMKTSFSQRRDNMAKMCLQVSNDVRHWNETPAGKNSPIQMDFDFTNDIADLSESEDYNPPEIEEI